MNGKEPLNALNDLRISLKAIDGSFGAGAAIARADSLSAVLADRFDRPYAPLIVAVCGPTGAGKSHLVNFLAGGAVSPSSYRRPSTVAPVAVGRPESLALLAGPGESGSFMPAYARIEAPDGARFESEAPPRPELYLAPLKNPSWPWPDELVLIDTPDFDSVRLENQAQALDMARRADAVILVAHQAKYADQSTWDFLAAESPARRPLMVVLNRLTDAAAADDFKRRLTEAGLTAPVLPWPEESAVGQVSVNAARADLTGWLSELGREARGLVSAGGRRVVADLGLTIREEIIPPYANRRRQLEDSLAEVRRITREWVAQPSDRVALHLPGETKESLLKGLGEVVSRSDLWAKPRRWLAVPFEALESGFKKLTGRGGEPGGAERKLADSVAEAGREALVTAVRDEARALAEAARLPSPQLDLDLSPEAIRERYQAMAGRLEAWLKEEMARLLAGLPLGQKAVFYFVQVFHIGLVAGLLVQTGGLPGTETLVGGALGPVISKLTGVIISRENLAAFESRAAERHRRELADIFQEQGRGYEEKLLGELEDLKAGQPLEADLKVLEKEAGRIWA